MKQIVDIVNFNADASCLSSESWFDILQDGNKSVLAQWLNLYVDQNKKVVLGFTGATVADIAMRNPEAIELINKHPDIFEIILRSFTHDIALLRLGKGFLINFEYGRRAIQKEFKNICNYFLPSEFMLTNEHVTLLSEREVMGVFINPARFNEEIKARIPTFPYKVRGLFGALLNCISFHRQLTDNYLHALHKFDCKKWNENILNTDVECLFSWRDGESSFFIPEGLYRESYWLENEDTTITREHIKKIQLNFVQNEQLGDYYYKAYPVHSFLAWMKEFRMIGFVNRIQQIEASLDRLTKEQISIWLMVIGSDILSAVEKKSPVIQLKKSPLSRNLHDFTIYRSERNFEGEEYLAILEQVISSNRTLEYIESSRFSHIEKLKSRINYLESL